MFNEEEFNTIRSLVRQELYLILLQEIGESTHLQIKSESQDAMIHTQLKKFVKSIIREILNDEISDEGEVSYEI